MDLKRLIEAWQLAPALHELRAPASTDALAAVERALDYTLPAELRALYLFSDGAGLVGGNLSYYPLSAPDGLSLEASSAQLRQYQWPIPDEVLVFGGDGCGNPFGLWMPASAAPQFPQPIVEIGQIFEPGCMALAGSSLTAFLLARTAFYLLCEGSTAALDRLGVPAALRTADPDDATFLALRNWADPALEAHDPSPYECGYDAQALAAIFARP
ncbi:MAG: SMI1/KNR4 family protein [Proteobacteria bacterium]|nr:SMI1/KNR4 family protein [Pseudomonadota bacterium]